MKQPLWLHRRLINTHDVFAWLAEAGVRKAMPVEELHFTQATVRMPVDWERLVLDPEDLVLPAGPKPTQIFAYTIKALSFQDPRIAARHADVLRMFPSMDHPVMRPHLSLYKGGRMPKSTYLGPLVFGPEIAEPFNPANVLGIKHVKVEDVLNR